MKLIAILLAATLLTGCVEYEDYDATQAHIRKLEQACEVFGGVGRVMHASAKSLRSNNTRMSVEGQCNYNVRVKLTWIVPTASVESTGRVE